MSLEGLASAKVLRGKINSVPDVVEAVRQVIVVSDTAPLLGPALWFNTDPYGEKEANVLLPLNDDESGSNVHAEVGDEVYGVGNMTVNGGATEQTYDFTVL